MVTVTDRAAELLKEIQTDPEEGQDKVLRIVSEGDGYELIFDSARAGDQVVQNGNTDILLVGDDVAPALEDAVIDCQDTPEGPRFVLSTGEQE